MSRVESSLSPLLDIALLLTAFLCTRRDVDSPVTIMLPTAEYSSESGAGLSNETVIAVQANGTISLNGEFIAQSKFSSISADQPVVLRADAETPWQYVFEVKSRLQSLGVDLVEQGERKESNGN